MVGTCAMGGASEAIRDRSNTVSRNSTQVGNKYTKVCDFVTHVRKKNLYYGYRADESKAKLAKPENFKPQGECHEKDLTIAGSTGHVGGSYTRVCRRREHDGS